ncbi:MAG: hypothetical protein AAFX76_06755 [Planctomycetota bacterium]
MRWSWCFVLSWLLPGCVAGPTESPVSAAAILDRSVTAEHRLPLVERADLAGEGAVELRAALHVVVWSDRHALDLRVAAMDRLIEHDAGGFWRAADRWLNRIDDQAMVDAVALRLVRDGRTGSLPTLVLRWSRDPEARIENRQELLAELDGGTHPADRLADLITEGDDRATAAAAWALLTAWEGPAAARAALADWSRDNVWVRDLVAAGEVLGRLPGSVEGWRRLDTLRADAARWSAWASAARSVHPDGRVELALHHLPVLLNAEPVRRRRGLDALTQGLDAALAGAAVVPRADTRSSPAAVRPGAWGDVLLALEVVDALKLPGVRASLFAQADADLANPRTEYGGVLTWDADGRPVARPHAPQEERGDRKFVSPPVLIKAAHTGLAHYHFHAQSYRSAEFAGPGPGDYAFTDALNAPTLVFTFVDRDTLNADLVFPGRVVVDLGGIKRPS